MWRQWAESLFWMRIHGCFRWEQLARAASSCVTLHQHLLLLLLRLRLRLRLFLMPNCSSLTARIGHDRFLSLAVVHLGDSGMVWITSPIDIIWICHSMRIKFNYHQLTSSSQVQFFLTGRFDCVRGHFNSDVSVRQNNNKTNQKEGGAKRKGRGGAKRGGGRSILTGIQDGSIHHSPLLISFLLRWEFQLNSFQLDWMILASRAPERAAGFVSRPWFKFPTS